MDVIRLNVAEPPGREAFAELGVEKVPAVLLYGSEGAPLHRTEGKLPRRALIAEALATEG